MQGVNSAATLWVTAGAGLAIGSGFQPLAWVILLVVLLAQLTLPYLAEKIDARSTQVMTATIHQLSVCCETQAVRNVLALWEAFAAHKGVEVVRSEEAKQESSDTSFQFACHLSPACAQELTALSRRFSETAGVKQVKWSKTEAET